MSEAFLGEVRIFSFIFAPKGWAQCNGQIMSIQQNQALFALLGTMYGGNGVNTFSLPDLRGAVTLGFGNNPQVGNFVQGQVGGEFNHTLTINEMPGHNHMVTASNAAGSQSSPQSNLSAQDPGGTTMYGSSPNTNLAPGAVAIAGGSQPHQNMMPCNTLNFCMALTGIFPSRN
jgi:microcystin-dependent protein